MARKILTEYTTISDDIPHHLRDEIMGKSVRALVDNDGPMSNRCWTVKMFVDPNSDGLNHDDRNT